MITELWNRPATIERNNFKFKSLSSWSYNVAVGCNHACRFCYVPEASTNRMSGKLAELGVEDPDAQWGEYVFPRQFNTGAFMSSLRTAEQTPPSELNADGNRAVMLCTTTDPYQVLKGPGFNEQMKLLVRSALQLILGHSTLNVRILTRSPLAKRDFDLMKQFGDRLLFGMSLPTLNNKLSAIYEPKAPAPTQRLATLRAAKKAGLNVFVAVAPTYPECDTHDMVATMRAVKELDPVTVFHEPINIRAENVARIEAHAKSIGATVRTGVFETPEKWRNYSLIQMHEFENLASRFGLSARLHLWPDQSLGSKSARAQFEKPNSWASILNPESYDAWLNRHWNKISAWPQTQNKVAA